MKVKNRQDLGAANLHARGCGEASGDNQGFVVVDKLIPFTDAELRRADVIMRLHREEITRQEASLLLDRCSKQVRRLLHRYVTDGLPGLVSKKRGKPSNNRLPVSYINDIIAIYKTDLLGCGPKYAAEILADEYCLKISREKLRNELINAGLWTPNLKPSERIHPPRRREECFGSMVQIDGTTHRWIEGLDPFCLLVFVDDGTSRLGLLHFTEAETSAAYLAQWKIYLERYGRPVKVLADGHAALFKRHGSPHLPLEQSLRSPLAQALLKLNIAPLPSSCAPGRGRVERSNRTLQDRLINYLRRHGARTMAQANELLPKFMEQYNRNFSHPPRNNIDRHLPVPPGWDLDLILTEQEKRRVSRSRTVALDHQTIVLNDSPIANAAINHDIVVHRHPDGRITLRFANTTLDYWVVDEHLGTASTRERAAEWSPGPMDSHEASLLH